MCAVELDADVDDGSDFDPLSGGTFKTTKPSINLMI